MRKKKKLVFSILAFQAAIAICCLAPSARAERTTHIIINEIQIAGANSNDEFIELYNPTDAPITLDGYKLSKKTKSGTESTLSSSTTSTKFLGTIPAHGYFLIAHSSYKDKISADLGYSPSYSIASDNTVLLYDKNSTLLDKVGFGLATDSENTPAINPSDGRSLERNNFADTNNNSVDFSMTASPSPRNKNFIETDSQNGSGDTGDGIDTSDTPDVCATSSTNIKLNEIFPNPESGDEFIEIRNTGEACLDVSGWKIMDGASHKKTFPENSILDPGEYLFLGGNLYLNNDSDTVYLLDKNGNLEIEALDSRFYEKAEKSLSFSLDGGTWSWTSTPTPGEKNLITASESDAIQTSDSGTSEHYQSAEKVYLNEILPNPKNDSDEEYIEIKNDEDISVDLLGWTIRDASKSGKYIFKEHAIIEPGGYLAVYKAQSKLALNNSGESVHLYDPQNDLVSSASYDKSQKGASYNFDSEAWKWSKYLTPGKKNKFDSVPTVKIAKTKNVYKNIPSKFSVKAKDRETKKLKFAWDFGDGKKSYLAKTSHKYLDTGKYTVMLAVSDDSQTIEKSFVINVKNSPRPDLEIVKIIPNPTGNDSEGEIVEIKNNSSKKVDLESWKIATGSGEKIYNHPIGGGLSIEPGQTKTITREFSKFSLGNSAGKVQLVMADGKIVDEVEYQKDKIAEDEAYAKIDGEWQWINPDVQDENTENKNIDSSDEPSDAETAPVEDENADGEVLGATDEIETASYDPSFTSEDAFIFLSRIYLHNPPAPANYCSANNSFSNIAYLLASTI